ncbi:hypothetical protein ACFL0V_03920 [Nanoarchaeota archaeon]
MTLEKDLDRLKNRLGLSKRPVIVDFVSDNDDPVTVSTDPLNHQITITISQDWAPDKTLKRYLKAKKIAKPKVVLARDLLYHAAAHTGLPDTRACPRTTAIHDLIIDSVVKARYDKGYDRDEKKERIIAHSFEDLVANYLQKSYTDNSGLVLYYYDKAKHGLSDFMQAFVKTNLFLWGDKHDKRILRPFFDEKEEVSLAVREIAQVFKLNSSETVHKDLVNPDQWHRMAYEFTLAICGLLPNNSTSDNPSVLSYDANAAIQDKKPNDHISEGLCELSSSLDDNVFDQELETDKDDIVAERFDSGKGKPSYMDDYIYLDTLYRSLARNIPLKVDIPSEAQCFPVAHFGFQPFDQEKHDYRRIKLSRFGIDPDGKVQLLTHRGDIEIQADYHTGISELPPIRIVHLDTSGSMQEPINRNRRHYTINPFVKTGQWDERSKYHHALIGKWGIDAYLDSKGYSDLIDTRLINFSCSAIASDRECLRNRSEENKLALSPQFRGTNLSIQTLENCLERRCFVISLSDGGFSNWHGMYDNSTSTKDKFLEIIQPHAFAHIQMGPSSEFTNDLEAWGFPVYFVDENNPIEFLMLDITKSYYDSFETFGGVRE